MERGGRQLGEEKARERERGKKPYVKKRWDNGKQSGTEPF